MADFIIRALIAGLSLALIAGPLGCFVVWRRMAYFGDTLAHSALLGVALGLLMDINMQFAVILSCCLLALILGLMEKSKSLATDTVLGILAHSSLALGLVCLSFTDTQIDLMAYLFGDLLTVSDQEVLWICLCSILAFGALIWAWKPLLNMTLHEELARVEGLAVDRYRLLLLILVALVIAVSMKVVGVLLITALLIIPPASARGLARSPKAMAILASGFGSLSVISGMGASFFWDTPTGPSIVVMAALIFIVSRSVPRQKI